jgi:hypothetical protein
MGVLALQFIAVLGSVWGTAMQRFALRPIALQFCHCNEAALALRLLAVAYGQAYGKPRSTEVLFCLRRSEMNKRDALRLEPGQRVIYGNSMWTVKIDKAREGEVLFVTRNGGIRVRNQFGDTEWVPYHHVISAPDFDCWWNGDRMSDDEAGESLSL